MSIMKNLTYNPKLDEIQGYQDHGHQGKSKVFASHALVFMLVWIRRMKKQPVAFYLSGDYVTADRLTVLIKEVLHECLKTGMNVCATVCDMDGVNVRALENLGSSVDHPYFEFEGKEIVSLPDPPHLLKCFRNLFLTYNVKLPIPIQSSSTAGTTKTEESTGTGVASWKHMSLSSSLNLTTQILTLCLHQSNCQNDISNQMEKKKCGSSWLPKYLATLWQWVYMQKHPLVSKLRRDYTCFIDC